MQKETSSSSSSKQERDDSREAAPGQEASESMDDSELARAKRLVKYPKGRPEPKQQQNQPKEETTPGAVATNSNGLQRFPHEKFRGAAAQPRASQGKMQATPGAVPLEPGLVESRATSVDETEPSAAALLDGWRKRAPKNRSRKAATQPGAVAEKRPNNDFRGLRINRKPLRSAASIMAPLRGLAKNFCGAPDPLSTSGSNSSSGSGDSGGRGLRKNNAPQQRQNNTNRSHNNYPAEISAPDSPGSTPIDLEDHPEAKAEIAGSSGFVETTNAVPEGLEILEQQMETYGSSHDVENATNDEEGLEMVKQQLVQAYAVSDPTIRATPCSNLETPKTGRGKKRWGLLPFLGTAGFTLVISSSVTIPFLFERDPNRREHHKMRKTIVDAFGESYFDNPQREKALHWILHEDPRNALDIKEQGHYQTNLVQRFSLAAFYFQTSVQQPWAYCNPPVGKQSDTCFYYSNPDSSRPNSVEATRWLSAAHECQWMGVVCDAGIAAEINIQNNNMTGSIPAEAIAMLKDLRYLWLVANNLIGPLPKILFESNKLQSIFLKNNQLMGDIPPQAFLMPKLKELALGYNQLRGSIPPEVGKFGGDMLQLDSNLLSGAIPQELYTATGLQRLNIGENLLTGNLSPAIGALSELYDFSVGGNPMEGSIPSEVGLLKHLSTFLASGSNLGGTIPEELYNCQKLLRLYLNSNQLSGRISTRVGLLKKLGYFDIADTIVGGTIPEELASLPQLQELSINGNTNLTGSVPEELCSHRNQRLKIVADCTPTLSTGVPAIQCRNHCCSTCCDAETKICTEQ